MLRVLMCLARCFKRSLDVRGVFTTQLLAASLRQGLLTVDLVLAEPALRVG